MSMSFADSPAVVGGATSTVVGSATSTVTERTPPGLQWGIQGPGVSGQNDGNRGIGSAECYKPVNPTDTPTGPVCFNLN